MNCVPHSFCLLHAFACCTHGAVVAALWLAVAAAVVDGMLMVVDGSWTTGIGIVDDVNLASAACASCCDGLTAPMMGVGDECCVRKLN